MKLKSKITREDYPIARSVRILQRRCYFLELSYYFKFINLIMELDVESTETIFCFFFLCSSIPILLVRQEKIQCRGTLFVRMGFGISNAVFIRPFLRIIFFWIIKVCNSRYMRIVFVEVAGEVCRPG